MKRMFSDERCGAAVLLLGGLVLVFFLAGCMKQEDQVVYTGAIIDVTLVPQSGDLPDTLPTLEDEVNASDEGSGTPILAGPPGVTPPGGQPAPGTPPEDVPRVSREDAGSCSSLLGVDANKIRVVHTTQTIQLGADFPLALKVTGNKPVVTLNLRGSEDITSFPGLCLFVMGHQAQVMVRVGVPMGALSYTGRGDQSYTQVQFDPAGSLVKSFLADLAGNQASLVVSGTGKHICPVARFSGNSPTISCTEN